MIEAAIEKFRFLTGNRSFPVSLHGEWQLLALLVAFSAGILFWFSLPLHPPPMVTVGSAIISILVATSLARRERFRPFVLMLVACLSGAIAITVRSEIVQGPVIERDTTAFIEATVRRSEVRGPRHRLLILENGQLNSRGKAVESLGVRAIVRTGVPEGLGAGDRVRLLVRVSPPGGPAVPGAYDFARASWFQGIGAVGIAMSDVEILEDHRGDAAVSRIREAVADKAATAMPGEAGGLAGAFLAGDRGRIDEDLQQAMRDAGLAHLLAISGLHLGLVTGLVFLVFNNLLALVPAIAGRIAVKKPAAVAAWGAALGYLALSGFALPTQRAFIMVSIGLLAVLLNRRVLSLRSVYLAALAMLILQPESLVSVGFQMSFAAVTALVAVYERYGDRLRPVSLSQGVLRWFSRWLLLSLITTLVAEMAIAPFALYHFLAVALFGLLANTLAIPLMSMVIMPLGLVMLLLMPFGLEFLVAPILSPALEMLAMIATEVSGLPGSVWHPGQMPDFSFALILLAGLTFLLARGIHVGAMAAFCLLLSVTYWQKREYPDILYDADGRLFAVYENGQLWFNSLRRGRFLRDKWRAWYGLAPDAPSGRLQMDCDASGCVFRSPGGLVIAVPETVSGVMDDCNRSDLILASGYWARHCDSEGAMILDREQSNGAGVIAAILGKVKEHGSIDWKVTTSAEIRGLRPWANDYLERERRSIDN